MTGFVHGVMCGSRTWPTKCPTCREEVFFFSCTCGSKVFFDELGAPWPLHSCFAQRHRVLADAVASGAISMVDSTIDPTARRWRERIDESFAQTIRQRRERSTPDPIVHMAPKRGAARHLVGILREWQQAANPFKEFRIPDTAMSRAMLGPLGRGLVSKITIHVPSADSEIESYTLWLPRSLVPTPCENGLTITATVCMRSAGTSHVWWATQFALVEDTEESSPTGGSERSEGEG